MFDPEREVEPVTCPRCGGEGFEWIDYDCRRCGGSGFVDPRTLEVATYEMVEPD